MTKFLVCFIFRYCLVGGFTPDPWRPFFPECWMESSIPSHFPWEWPQSRLHLQESPSNGDPYPGKVKTTGYLHCPPENELVVSRFSMVFRFSVLPPRVFLGVGAGTGKCCHSSFIKSGCLLIHSDLV